MSGGRLINNPKRLLLFVAVPPYVLGNKISFEFIDQSNQIFRSPTPLFRAGNKQRLRVLKENFSDSHGFLSEKSPKYENESKDAQVLKLKLKIVNRVSKVELLFHFDVSHHAPPKV